MPLQVKSRAVCASLRGVKGFCSEVFTTATRPDLSVDKGYDSVDKILKNLNSIVKDCAPVFVQQQDDLYRPCSGEWFVKNCKKTDERAKGDESSLELKDKTTEFDPRWGDIESARVYVNVKIDQDVTYIQYWCLHAYNGHGRLSLKSIGEFDLPFGQHEGDWEYVSIKADNDTLRPRQIWLSAHSSGKWIDIQEVTSEKTGRITVFPSKHGHGMYPSGDSDNLSNKFDEFLSGGLVNDTRHPSDDPRLHLDAKERHTVLAVHDIRDKDNPREVLSTDVQKCDWMKYEGRWGRVVDISHALDLPGVPGWMNEAINKIAKREWKEELVERGPTPPWKKDSWSKDEA